MSDAARIRAAVEAVPDPELPGLTVGMLGMLHDLEVGPGRVRVELLPTYAACPATDVIVADVAAAVREVAPDVEVEVRLRYEPRWTPARITAEGRRRLSEVGIAPPQTAVDRPDRPLPLVPVPCPYCGSTRTQRESPFGPTPCRAIHHCADCRQPFEAIKPL